MPAPPAASFKKPCKETAVEEFGHGFHSSRTKLVGQRFFFWYFIFILLVSGVIICASLPPIVPLPYRIFMLNNNKLHSKLNTSLSFWDDQDRWQQVLCCLRVDGFGEPYTAHILRMWPRHSSHILLKKRCPNYCHLYELPYQPVLLLNMYCAIR